jgi:hypothetical protein
MTKFQVQVLLTPQEGATQEWACPGGVNVRLKEGQRTAGSGKTNAEGVIDDIELEAGKTYQVSITDPEFSLWRTAKLIPRTTTNLKVRLSPKPDYGFLLLRLVTSTGEPVSSGSVTVTTTGAPATFTSYASGFAYLVAPPGQGTLEFQLEANQQLCPRDFFIPYVITAAKEVKALEIVYWPTIMIVVSPTIATPGSSIQAALPETRVRVEYSVSPGETGTWREKVLEKTAAGAMQPSEISFEYAFPGYYTVTAIAPTTYDNMLVEQPKQSVLESVRLSPGVHPMSAAFETVPAEQISINIIMPENQQLTDPLYLQIHGPDGITIPIQARYSPFLVPIQQGGGDWTIQLDPAAAAPTLGGKPVKIVNMGQAVAVTQDAKVVFEYINSITINAVDEQGHPVQGAVIDIFSSTENLVGTVITDPDGQGTVGLGCSGTYYVAERSVGGETVRLEPVTVSSGKTYNMLLRRDRGLPKAGGEALTDLSAYPVLTEEISTTGIPAPAAGGPAGGGPGAGYGQTVEQVMRDVLGWRPSGDVAGFQAALTGAFQLREVEGHTEWSWQQRGYAVQADMGALTGAQASIYARAKAALDQIQPLLAGLTTLNPAKYEPQDLESIRSVVGTELQELVNELAWEGGPRIQRVDELFRLLLGEGRKSHSMDPDLVQGNLGTLRERFALTVDEIQTVDEERIVTNFRIIVELVLALHASWNFDRKLLSGAGPKVALGTILIWLSRGLEAVCESVGDLLFALDSVYVDAAQRQVVELRFEDIREVDLPEVPFRGNPPQTVTEHLAHQAPMFLSDLLDWVLRASRDEGPRIIQDSGKDGVLAFKPVLNTLRILVRATAKIARERNAMPAGMRTPRVDRAIKVLAAQLDEAANLASLVRVELAPQIAFASILNPSSKQPVSMATLPGLSQIEVVMTGRNFRGPAKAILMAEQNEDLPDLRAKVTINTPSTASVIFDNPATDPVNAGTTWVVSIINNDETQSDPIEVLRVPR